MELFNPPRRVTSFSVSAQVSGQPLETAYVATGMVQVLIEMGADIASQAGSCPSALSTAAFEGKLATLRYLLDIGADPNFPENERGQGPLSYAVMSWSMSCNEEAAEILIAAGADIHRETLLYDAISASSPEGVRFLLERGIDPNLAAASQEMPLRCTYLCEYANQQREIIELLLDYGAIPLDDNNLSDIWFAVEDEETGLLDVSPTIMNPQSSENRDLIGHQD